MTIEKIKVNAVNVTAFQRLPGGKRRTKTTTVYGTTIEEAIAAFRAAVALRGGAPKKKSKKS